MRDKIKEIALQVGGSHYPDVGGELLQKFSDSLIEECIKAIRETPNHRCLTYYEVANAEDTKEECIKHIKNVLM